MVLRDVQKHGELKKFANHCSRRLISKYFCKIRRCLGLWGWENFPGTGVLDLISPDPVNIGSEGRMFVHIYGCRLYLGWKYVPLLQVSLTGMLLFLYKVRARTDPPSPTRILLLLFRAFAKLRKATISFVTSVRLSVHKKQLGFHWMDFHEI